MAQVVCLLLLPRFDSKLNGLNVKGKSTTLSMLTGLMPATRGSIFVHGKEISSNLSEVRANMGWCPQHNILFSKLTVDEHLRFFARLKQPNTEPVADTIDAMLDDIGLREKRNCLVHTLSGGMQRKLSVAIAFIGNARVVLLDEPTAGELPARCFHYFSFQN
jgi:ABC-type multidrug transport system ATPase subunit